jgi:hypothetical protein
VSGTVGLGQHRRRRRRDLARRPGATFWMICAGFLGMATKLADARWA